MRVSTAILAGILALSAHAAAAQIAGGGSAAAPMIGCGGDLARLNQLSGWQMSWPAELQALANRGPEQQRAALERWRHAPAALRMDVVALRAGLSRGDAAPAPVARRVLAQVDGLLASGPVAPGLKDPEWRRLLDGELRTEIRTYARFLRREYAPKAPPASSLATRPGGEACFAKAIASWTSLDLSPAEVEALGASLLARYRAELTTLARRPPQDSAAVLDELRARGAHGDATRGSILSISTAAIARAEAATPAAFGYDRAPHLKVVPIVPALESSLPAGFYDPATKDSPAAYQINLSRPAERRLMAEVIAFHEGFPGHHLAFSMAQRPGVFNSGFVEGWGIYAEHLADELNLYSSSEDRMGAVAKHLWATSRLIVEPGLHVHGWSREKAIEFMRANTALSDDEIAIEVDRYLGVPGQSIAYMVGYAEILKARDRTQKRQGAAFDLPAFHRALLEPGPRSLKDLEREFP